MSTKIPVKPQEMRKIPIHKFSGTHFSCFQNIGKTFKEMLHGAYEIFKTPFEGWCQKYPDAFSNFKDIVRRFFPTIQKELEGLCSGSGLTFDQVFSFQIISEFMDWKQTDFSGIDPLPEEEDEDEEKNINCSDVLINKMNNFSCIGHNEDNDPEQDGVFMLLDISILHNENKINLKLKERIVYFSFPGLLPGWTYGFNSHGLVMTGNSTTCRKYNKDGIPLFCINRKCISSESINDVVLNTLMNPQNRLRNYGFALNFASISEGRMMSTEFCTNKISFFEVEEGTYFTRANRYDLLQDKNYMKSTPNSISRRNRLSEIIKNENQKKKDKFIDLKLVFSALGDEEDEIHPVFVRKEKKKPSFTNSSVVFHLEGKKMLVFSQNPKDNDPFLVIDMVDFSRRISC